MIWYFCAVNLIRHIKKHISEHELPGEEAHVHLSPSVRIRTSKAKEHPDFNPKLSAVLLVLFPDGNKWHNVLIQRTSYEGVHSGQIAFPGGRIEDTDLSLEHTALRETQEEIGIPLEKLNLIGRLSEVYIPPSNYLVQPYMAYTNERPLFVPEKKEVEEVFSYPLERLLEKDVVKQTEILLSNNFKLKTPYFDIHNKIVWGATAIILSEFRELLKKL